MTVFTVLGSSACNVDAPHDGPTNLDTEQENMTWSHKNEDNLADNTVHYCSLGRCDEQFDRHNTVKPFRRKPDECFERGTDDPSRVFPVSSKDCSHAHCDAGHVGRTRLDWRGAAPISARQAGYPAYPLSAIYSMAEGNRI